MTEKFNYEVNLEWNHGRKGTMSAPGIASEITVVTPPEFPQGIPGFWSPEHLFVAALNSCIMATFLAIAENSKVEIISYSSNAIGKLEMVDGNYEIALIVVRPKIMIYDATNIERLYRIIELSRKNCFISNSIKTSVQFEPDIVLQQYLE